LVAFSGDQEVANDAVAEAFAQALGRGAAGTAHGNLIRTLEPGWSVAVWALKSGHFPEEDLLEFCRREEEALRVVTARKT
jgi:hypothetical protein